ncbi:hypothetical protein H072_10532 [Dactylellina haptotyla CBS 200.50]|uniref:Uncharacterized protein n=1 Tax=Dactylellina haptotyla (strain CBS 200.50) TaxID=1284197 RepID=S8BLE4_DACHA|nr:hypothetical protein H072_10532 [Dactylellina haptotyla CBS 200.50]
MAPETKPTLLTLPAEIISQIFSEFLYGEIPVNLIFYSPIQVPEWREETQGTRPLENPRLLSDNLPCHLACETPSAHDVLPLEYFLVSHAFTENITNTFDHLRHSIESAVSQIQLGSLLHPRNLTKTETSTILNLLPRSRVIFAGHNENTIETFKLIPETIRQGVKSIYFTSTNTKFKSAGDPLIGDPLWESQYTSPTGKLISRPSSREQLNTGLADWFPKLDVLALAADELKYDRAHMLVEGCDLIARGLSTLEIIYDHRVRDEYTPSDVEYERESSALWQMFVGRTHGFSVMKHDPAEYIAVDPGSEWGEVFNRREGSTGAIGMRLAQVPKREVRRRGRFVRTWNPEMMEEECVLEEKDAWRFQLVRISQDISDELDRLDMEDDSRAEMSLMSRID